MESSIGHSRRASSPRCLQQSRARSKLSYEPSWLRRRSNSSSHIEPKSRPGSEPPDAGASPPTVFVGRTGLSTPIRDLNRVAVELSRTSWSGRQGHQPVLLAGSSAGCQLLRQRCSEWSATLRTMQLRTWPADSAQQERCENCSHCAARCADETENGVRYSESPGQSRLVPIGLLAPTPDCGDLAPSESLLFDSLR